MAERSMTAIDFRVNGDCVESINHPNPPHVGDIVEIGAKFGGGERIDPGVASYDEWLNADYETVLTGKVTNVTRHYHTAYDRLELTVYVDLDVIERLDQ